MKKAIRADLSVLRSLATLTIILLHTCSTLADNSMIFTMTEKQLAFCECVRHLAGCALPLFFMITGVILLDSNRIITPRLCIGKYARRLLYALILFGVPFSVMIKIAANKTFSLEYVWGGVIAVISGDSFSHLWYLYVLIGIYLIMPLLKCYTDHVDHEEQRYLIGLLFLFNFIVPFLSILLEIKINFALPISSFAVFYILLGRYLDDECKNKQLNKLALLAIIGSIAVLIALLTIYVCPIQNGILSYSSPVIAIMSTAIYMLLYGVKVKNKDRIWKLDRLCFGVYLIHPVFIHLIYRVLHITPLNFGKGWILVIIPFWLLISLLSFFSVWGMYKIKLLRKYIL